ncbi:MAG: VIT1/CCC1 transporter family protein [Patescibacteria group bacterium]
MLTHREKHIQIGRYLKDVVFAANDGIVTTFAVVAGVIGAELSTSVILIIGFANLLADGFSMATGNYLGTKSEKEFYKKEESVERYEIETVRNKEVEEIRSILAKKGYSGENLAQMVDLICSNKQYWVDFMMHEELGLFAEESRSPFRHGIATFFSFVIIGSVPLLPYVLGFNSFAASAVASGAALFIAGALRKYFSGRSWIISGLEMLIAGGLASTIAYTIGVLLKAVIA